MTREGKNKDNIKKEFLTSLKNKKIINCEFENKQKYYNCTKPDVIVIII